MRYQHAQTLIVIALALLFMTISLDLLTNGATFIPHSVRGALEITEEGFKILYVGIFIECVCNYLNILA